MAGVLVLQSDRSLVSRRLGLQAQRRDSYNIACLLGTKLRGRPPPGVVLVVVEALGSET
jgi:hypothetical protein